MGRLRPLSAAIMSPVLVAILALPAFAQEEKPAQLEEVIVTAEKRAEGVQNVPVPVSVVSASTLLDTHQVKIQDYASTVPGLAFAPDGTGGGDLTIRGLAAVNANPTVGVLIDDVPFGASTSHGGAAGSSLFPDIDPADLQRVEVLRGPQGTLYGAGSMGGLVKFVTVDPSTEAVKGTIAADVNGASHSDETGYGLRAAVNVPITGTLAIRMSGFGRRDPGYIDDIQSGVQKDVNSIAADGGHFSALWKPSSDFSLKLSALYQNSNAHGFPLVNLGPGFGELQQSTLPGTGSVRNVVQAYSLTAQARVGAGELTFLSGYNINDDRNSTDATTVLGALSQYGGDGFGIPGTGFNGFGVAGTPYTQVLKVKKVSEELRLRYPLGSKVDWLIGGFYTREVTDNLSSIYAGTSSTDIVGFVGSFLYGINYNEYAAFTDFTFHLTDRLDLQVGGRESRNTQSENQTDRGGYSTVFHGSDPFVYKEIDSQGNDFTFLVTPKYTVSPNLMVYARIASGYRPGGPNADHLVTGGPSQFEADKTTNYELGLKGNALDRALTFDASVYYIDWSKIQIQIATPDGLGFYDNGGKAKSQGIEVSVEARPLHGLTISAWGAFNDAVLSENFPSNSSVYGASGDRLPFAARLSGNVSIQQDFPITPDWTAFIGATESYVGDHVGVFTPGGPAPPPRQDFPGYAKTDLRAGASYHEWSVAVFVNNVADKRALEAGGLGYFLPTFYGVIPPRTYGLSIARTFRGAER